MMTNLKQFICPSILALVAMSVLSACSVERAEVSNQPPTINKGVVKFDTEFGALDLESVTAFFWPEGLTEAQTIEVVKTVKGASIELDAMALQADEMKADFGKLVREFMVKQCGAWAGATQPSGMGPQAPNWIVQWKDLPEGASEEQSAARAACMTNQGLRMKLAHGLQGLKTKSEATVAGKIFKTLDPTFPAKQENWKSITPAGSSLELKQTETGAVSVGLTFKDFFRKGITMTNQPAVLKAVNEANLPAEHALEMSKVSYDSERKLLRFSVPELNDQGEPTGAVMNFALERNPNFRGLVRFAGDFTLEKNGVVLRYGSAKLEGQFKK